MQVASVIVSSKLAFKRKIRFRVFAEAFARNFFKSEFLDAFCEKSLPYFETIL
jgi:hypothetical protein